MGLAWSVVVGRWALSRACPEHSPSKRSRHPSLATLLNASPLNAPSQPPQTQAKFLRGLPGIEAWQKGVLADCKRLGYVEVRGQRRCCWGGAWLQARLCRHVSPGRLEPAALPQQHATPSPQTLAGRRRYLPAINSGNCDAQKHAERKALNTVCQGSAADLAKAAMIGIHRRLAALGTAGAHAAACCLLVVLACPTASPALRAAAHAPARAAPPNRPSFAALCCRCGADARPAGGPAGAADSR